MTHFTTGSKLGELYTVLPKHEINCDHGSLKKNIPKGSQGGQQGASESQEQQGSQDRSRISVITEARQEELRLVLVEWEDAYGCSVTWEIIDGVDPPRMLCRSVGWLVYDGEDRKVIVPHLLRDFDGTRKGCGDMTIPTGIIVRIVDLAEDGCHRGNS